MSKKVFPGFFLMACDAWLLAYRCLPVEEEFSEGHKDGHEKTSKRSCHQAAVLALCGPQFPTRLSSATRICIPDFDGRRRSRCPAHAKRCLPLRPGRGDHGLSNSR